ncbi:tetratricopeptide repeat-containing sensor histidine kinase [Flavobacterium terrisoli]|uniref:tetratricopeptide repeat-containing sensor histidine kinase n=1 Tax=Flavobacterium terrisoli TaxID=3242195 RepID=UPI0025428CAA|nr:sensor histidine kinase [Flavobacterium buctense]
MKKRIGFLLLLFIIFYGCNTKSTDKNTSANNDSIQKYLALAGNDTLDFAKRIKYNEKAASFLDLKKNDSLTREYLSLVVYYSLSTKNWSSFKKNSVYFFKKVTEAKDTLGLARHYKYNGFYCSRKMIFDSAFYNFLKSEKMYKKIKNENGLANLYSSMADVQFKLDDNLGSELSAEKAYQHSKKTNNIIGQFLSLINIGNANHNLNQYEKAISAFKSALSLARRNNLKKKNYSYIGTCLNNIGNTYRVQKKYKTAIYYFKLGLQEKNIAHSDPELYAYLLNNLGYCYLKTNKNNKLLKLFEQSKKIFDSLGIKNESAISDIYLSEVYLNRKDTLKANLYAESALKLAKEADAPYYYVTALTNAGSINPKKAPKYIQEYHRLNDSLLFAERTARNQYYKIQLETDEVTAEKNTALKQRSIVVAIALTLLFITVLIFIIARQRIKQKELRLQQAQQNANEEIYQLMLTQKSKEEQARQIEKKRIGQDLHDGVMNKLASTRLHLSILSINRDKNTIDKCLTHINEIQDIEKEIRNIAHDLNHEVFDQPNSFGKLLEDFVAEQNKTANTTFTLKTKGTIDWNIVSGSKKMNLYRIIQEASHNINKHAKAKKATISILIDNDNINLSITDDGIGFNPSDSTKGIGLKNMKHRVKLLKGKFSISAQTNATTSINIAIPL